MRILSAELRKTLTIRFFLILLVAVTANILLFRHNLSGDYRAYGQEAYIAAQKDILSVESSQRASFLQERARMLSACGEWEYYDRTVQDGDATNLEITQDMLEFREAYESGAYLKYTDSLSRESGLIQALLKQVNQVGNHHATLNSAIEEATLKTSISIFAKPGTFAYRSQLATIDRLQELLHIQPQYDISDGVLKSQTSVATDLIGLMLVLFLCTEMVVTEQKNGMLPILRATRNGRLPLILAKIAAAFALTFFVTLFLWGINLAYCGITFGLGDLSRPVQSLTGFTTCPLELSVGGYMVLTFLIKWLLYAAVGLLCLIFGLLFGSAMPTWLTLGGFLSIEYVLSRIPAVSAWNLLKYMNIGNLIFSSDWLSEYRNLNLLGYPVDAFTVSAILLISLLIMSILLACLLFCRRKSSGLLQLKIRYPRWLPRPGRSTNLLGHESWKLLIECGGLLVLIVFTALNLQEPDYISCGAEELYYRNYMISLEGPINQKTEEYLQQEETRFQSIREEIAQYNKLYAQGQISSGELTLLTSPLTRQLEAEEVLKQQVIPRVEQVKARTAEGKEAWILYDPGYQYLFGANPRHEKTGGAAILLAGIILCFSNFYPLESTTGMLPLLNTYRRGRGATARMKLILCGGLTVLLFGIAQIPDYWYVVRNYGFPAIHAPLCSIEAFAAWSDGISILEGIIIFEAARLVTAIALTVIVLLIALWTKNQIVTLSIAADTLLMPLLLHLLDIPLLDRFSFYLPLTGTGLMCNQATYTKSVVYYVTVLGLGIVSVVWILRYVGRGYRFQK